MKSANFNDRFKDDRSKCFPWSDHVVQRRRAVARTDSDAPSQPPTPPTPPGKECSNCNCSCWRSRPGSREDPVGRFRERERAGAEEVEPAAQRVEAKLYNAELEETAHDERVETTREKLRRAALVLEAQELFSQSLHLKARALARLTQVTGSFACNDLLTSPALEGALDDIRWDVSGLSERLDEVADVAGAAVETPDKLYQLLDDFRNKKKGFQMAAKALMQQLRTSKRVTARQSRQAEADYDSMRESYDDSRKLLEKELSKLKESRQAVVEQCFSKLAPLQERMVEQDKQFLALSKEVSKSFQELQKQSRRCSQNYDRKDYSR